jgi:hypothetical protein
VAEGQFCTAIAYRCPREPCQYESIDLAPSFSGGDGHEPSAISKVATIKRSSAVDAHGAYRCCYRGISRGLRESFPIQPRVQPVIWRAAVTRHHELAATGGRWEEGVGGKGSEDWR